MDTEGRLVIVLRPLLADVLEAIEDTILELDSPEVAELTSLALDRKLENAKQLLTEVLANGEAY